MASPCCSFIAATFARISSPRPSAHAKEPAAQDITRLSRDRRFIPVLLAQSKQMPVRRPRKRLAFAAKKRWAAAKKAGKNRLGLLPCALGACVGFDKRT